MSDTITLPRHPRYTSKSNGYRFEKPSFSYVINENKTGVINGHPYKGVVVAKLYGGTADFANLWTKRDKFSLGMMERISYDLLSDDAFSGPSSEDFDFTGVAYCSVDDEWDMARGMKEARRKAWAQYYHCLEQYLIKYSNAVTDLSEQVYKYFLFAAKRHNELDAQNSDIQKALDMAQEIV